MFWVQSDNTNTNSFNYAKLMGARAAKSNSKKLYISFLIARNIVFGEKYPPTAFLFGYPNIVIFYSGFHARQK